MTIQSTLPAPTGVGRHGGDEHAGMAFVYAMFTLYGVGCGTFLGWLLFH